MTDILKSDPAATGTARARIHLTDSDSAISPRRHPPHPPPGPAASSRCCIRTADAPTLQPASALRESASRFPKWSSLTSCAQPPPTRPHIVFSATAHAIVYRALVLPETTAERDASPTYQKVCNCEYLSMGGYPVVPAVH
jgi:hypothetical protein